MPQAIQATDIAVSGLKAQRMRMNLIANNVANAFTTRTPEGGPFRRQLAILRGESVGPSFDAGKMGVSVSRVTRDRSAFRPVFDPGHPDANAEGYVNYPNVRLAVEMVDLISAQRAYEANINVILTSRRMSDAATEIIRVG